MNVFDSDVDALARAMIKNFPTDAADRAAMRSNAFLVLGYAEKSKKWLEVSDEIKKIRAAQDATAGADGPRVAGKPHGAASAG